MQEAISANSFYQLTPKIECGDVDSAFSSSKHSIEGEIQVGGQEHFYLETQACIAIPKGERGEMEIISATQNLLGTQLGVAKVLGVPSNRIVAKVKRIGGGFGGKEAQSVYLANAAAVAANK